MTRNRNIALLARRHRQPRSAGINVRRLRFECLELRSLLANGDLGQISGIVFYDGNGNGRQDSNEAGLAGWNVFLDDNDNRIQDANEAAATSDAAGNFVFTEVPKGLHLVRLTERDGWTRTVPFADVYSVILSADESVSGLLFGNQIANSNLYATISGFKWNDLDQDGLRDGNEPGLAGWQIYLDLNNNSQLDSFEPFTYTNSAGRYSFEQLPPVAAMVREVQQLGWQQSFPTNGGHFIPLAEGQVVDPVNFGNHLALSGQLVGSKWRDLDQDGYRDANEPPLANWRFYLDDNRNGAWDTGEPTTTTNSQGVFQFLGLAPGPHQVGEILPSGWKQTSPGSSSGFTAAQAFDLPKLPLLAGLNDVSGELATGDLDGDGDLDVVATTRHSIVVLYNDGNGQLAASRELALPGSESTGSLVLTDLNGDGRLDIVAGGRTTEAAAGSTGRLFSFLNRVGGIGGLPAEVSVRVSPDFLVQGDFDGDGRLDLATCGRGGREISLFLGDGQGGLTDTSVSSLTAGLGMEFSDLASADFDQDGRTDLAALGNSSFATGPQSQSLFQAWQSRASGDFLATNLLTLSGTARDLFAKDLRGDAKPEILVLLETPSVNSTTTSIQELSLANWQASAGASLTVHSGGGLDQARSQAIDSADFDRDGNADLVVLDQLGRSIWILNGLDNGSFGSPQSTPLGDQPLAVVAALLDGDSAPDLAVLNGYSSSVSVLQNDGWGGFPRVDHWNAGQQLDDVTPIDVDGDGDLDLVGIDLLHGQLSISLNRGLRHFDSPRVFQLERNLAAVLFGDLNGDGRLDLVTIANSQTLAGTSVFDVVTRLDLSSRGWASLPPVAASLEFPGRATAGSLADLNKNGVLDLVVTFGRSEQSPELDRLTLLGIGGGQFAALADSALRPQLSGSELFVDLDRDGDLDRVAIQTAMDTISVQMNLGGGGFAPADFFNVGQAPQYAVAGDFDGDQDLDLLVANSASANLSLLLNDGNAGLSASSPIAVGGHPVSLAAVDFDVDGFLDVAVVDDAANGVRILRATGPATFDNLGLWNVGAGPSGIVTGDWNRDGRPDLATVDTLGGVVTVLLQSVGVSFTSQSFPTGEAPVNLMAGYLDADEFLDLYVSRDVAGSERLFELLNDRSGGFGDPVELAIDRTVRDSTLADVTGDSLTDLVVVDDFSRSLLVFPGRGDGYFASPRTTPLDARPHFVRAIDVDGDTDLDLSIGWLDRAGIGLLINDGTGGFSAGTDYLRGHPPRPYWTGDLDEDGHQDYVIPDPLGGFYDFVRGLGDGTFAPPFSMAGDQPGSASAGDLDGDGNLDLVGSLLGDQFAVYWNQTRPDDQYRVTILPGTSSTEISFGNYTAPRVWQNPRSLLDVNDDTFISPIDALLVIDRLNASGAGFLPPPSGANAPPPYYDPSGDDFIAPNDALLIINYLNALAAGEAGEGEAFQPLSPVSSNSTARLVSNRNLLEWAPIAVDATSAVVSSVSISSLNSASPTSTTFQTPTFAAYSLTQAGPELPDEVASVAVDAGVSDTPHRQSLEILRASVEKFFAELAAEE